MTTAPPSSSSSSSSSSAPTSTSPSSTPYHSPSSSLVLFDPSIDSHLVAVNLPGLDSLRSSPLSTPLSTPHSRQKNNNPLITYTTTSTTPLGKHIKQPSPPPTNRGERGEKGGLNSEEVSLIRASPEISMVADSISESKNIKTFASKAGSTHGGPGGWRDSGSVLLTPAGTQAETLTNENYEIQPTTSNNPPTGVRRSSSAESLLPASD